MNMKKILIVAEIGCNHNGDKKLAKKLVEEAAKCNVDAVKFQTFNASSLISKYAPKAEYQKATTGNNENQLDMVKKLELSEADYLELKEYAESLGLSVFSTAFDLDSIDFLQKTGQYIWKIPSGEITNLPYLQKIGALKCDADGHKKEIIMSTGMATIDEIRDCLNVLLKSGADKKDIVILHCNTEYPTPDEDVNIAAIRDLHDKFPDMRIGFSDHSDGFVAAVGAVTMGIELIEKHFTLDKNMEGPDHKASATPDELRALVENVRRMEVILGSGVKQVTPSERKNIVVARKSIVAKKAIAKGEVFTEENITCKRPGSGISPMKWYEVLGCKAERDFAEDELITMEGLEGIGK